MLVTCKTFWRCLVGAVLLLNLLFWLLIPTDLHHRSGELIVSGAEEPANPLSLIDSAAVGTAFSDVAVVSAETVTVTTVPASTSETEEPANPLSFIDSAAVGAAFSDVAVVSAETVTVTTVPASTSETEEPANPLSFIDSAAVGAAFSDVAVVSAETVTVTTVPASTSETEEPANPLSLIDSAAVGAAFSDVAVVSAETVTVTTVPASTSETEGSNATGVAAVEAAPAVLPPAPPKLPPLQRRCDPREELNKNKTCNFPRRLCKLSHVDILGPGGTGCPQDAWVNAMVRADPDPHKVIMNVGCNKGHDSIAWLQRFDQRGFWNLRKWTSLMADHRAVCPLDTQIRKPPPRLGGSSRQVYLPGSMVEFFAYVEGAKAQGRVLATVEGTRRGVRGEPGWTSA
ncbi:unnamed protein product, partial [Cladocopium goreaui]